MPVGDSADQLPWAPSGASVVVDAVRGRRPLGAVHRPEATLYVPDCDVLVVAIRDRQVSRVGQSLSGSTDLREGSFEVTGRRADDPQDLGVRRLPQERRIEIVEQLRIGDGNRRLFRERLENATVSRFERPHFKPADSELAVVNVIHHQRNRQDAAEGSIQCDRWTVEVPGYREVDSFWYGLTDAEVGLDLLVGGSDLYELIALAAKNSGSCGVAQFGCLGNDAIEHSLQVARIVADQRKDFAGGRLQLQRFIEVVEEFGVGDRQGRLFRKRLGDVTLALNERSQLHPRQGEQPEQLVLRPQVDGQRAANVGDHRLVRSADLAEVCDESLRLVGVRGRRRKRPTHQPRVHQ